MYVIKSKWVSFFKCLCIFFYCAPRIVLDLHLQEELENNSY